MGKKILAITHQLDRSGAPVALFNLLEIFSETGWDISLISLKSGDLSTEAEKKGYPLHIRERFLGDFESFEKEVEGCDFVIVNSLACFDSIHALSRMEVPVIWWIHEGAQIFDFLKDVLPDFKSLSTNIRIFAVSERVKKITEEITGVVPFVLPLPVMNKPRNNPISYAEKVKFITIGTYSSIKGQDILCGAIKSLPTELMNKAEFLFCGSEETFDEEVFEEVKALSKEYPNVKILGSLPHHEILKVIEESDCLLAPSRIDMLPTVGLEALMKETLCVLSSGCGLSGYITDGVSGFVVPSENEKALAERIANIIINIDKYEGIRRAGREVFITEFSKDALSPGILSLAENLTSKDNRLVIFVGVYDILDIFAYRLQDAFTEMGYEIFLFDSSDMAGSLSRLGPFVEKPVKAMITLNNLGYNMELRPGSIIWDDLNIPVINILMDHPFCYRDALMNSPKISIVLSPDLNHMNYTARFFPNIPVSGFLAHGGIELPGPKKKIKDRKYDVVYTGGISRANVEKIIPDWTKYGFDAKSLCDDVIAQIIENPEITTEEGIEKALLSARIVVDDETLSQYITEFHFIDLYVVSHYREKVVESIAKSGINLELYGVGWEICDWINLPNVHFHGRIPAEEVLTIMKEAKIVLSTMTWFKEGTHDRVFNGMLQGALTVSDESGYMNREFVGRKNSDGSDKREMILFSLSEIDKLPMQVEEMLKNPDLAQEIADRGYLKAKAGHTWMSRAKEIHEDILKQL